MTCTGFTDYHSNQCVYHADTQFQEECRRERRKYVHMQFSITHGWFIQLVLSLLAIIAINVFILLIHRSRKNVEEKGGSKYTCSLVVPMVGLYD